MPGNGRARPGPPVRPRAAGRIAVPNKRAATAGSYAGRQDSRGPVVSHLVEEAQAQRTQRSGLPAADRAPAMLGSRTAPRPPPLRTPAHSVEVPRCTCRSIACSTSSLCAGTLGPRQRRAPWRPAAEAAGAGRAPAASFLRRWAAEARPSGASRVPCGRPWLGHRRTGGAAARGSSTPLPRQ